MKTHFFLQKRPPFSSSSSSSSSSCSSIDSPLSLLLSHLLLPCYVFLSFSSIIHCFLFYLQTAFHFRLLLCPPIFRFSFLVQCSPLLALYRSLALSLSLSSPSSPSSAIHSSSSFSCFLLLAPLLFLIAVFLSFFHLILLFRPIVLVLSLLFMIVLLLFPNPSSVSLLSLSSTFILPFFLNIVLSLFSFLPFPLHIFHLIILLFDIPLCLHLLLFFLPLSLSLSILLFRVHAVLPLVLYHSSFTSSDVLYFFLFVLPFSYFISYVFFLSCFLFIYFSCA